MTHQEFVESYRSGRTVVRVNRSLAFRVMDSPLFPLRYRAAWTFWTWAWFLMFPGSIALGVLYHWWAGVLCLLLSGPVRKGITRSAFEFVLEYALEDAGFYAKMQDLGMFDVELTTIQSTSAELGFVSH